MERRYELEVTRRSIAMVQRGQLAMRRDDALALIDELQALRRRHEILRLGCRKSSTKTPETLPVATYRAAVADEDVWLSTAEAASRLGVTPRRLYEVLDQGRLTGYRFGRVIRVKAADVQRFIDEDDDGIAHP